MLAVTHSTFTQLDKPTHDSSKLLLVLTAPTKEFKAVSNSVSRIIEVMEAKLEDSV